MGREGKVLVVVRPVGVEGAVIVKVAAGLMVKVVVVVD